MNITIKASRITMKFTYHYSISLLVFRTAKVPSKLMTNETILSVFK